MGGLRLGLIGTRRRSLGLQEPLEELWVGFHCGLEVTGCCFLSLGGQRKVSDDGGWDVTGGARVGRLSVATMW